MPTKERAVQGLVLHGTVETRRRREVVGKSGEKRYILTLAVRCGDRTMLCDRWSNVANPEGVPALGEAVDLPVRVGAYLSGGSACARLSWGEIEVSGEVF